MKSLFKKITNKVRNFDQKLYTNTYNFTIHHFVNAKISVCNISSKADTQEEKCIS